MLGMGGGGTEAAGAAKAPPAVATRVTTAAERAGRRNLREAEDVLLLGTLGMGMTSPFTGIEFRFPVGCKQDDEPGRNGSRSRLRKMRPRDEAGRYRGTVSPPQGRSVRRGPRMAGSDG
ncbi:hypothetical protein GCM10011578_049580 [Streptomyces fuscichromogenes]|uniref:Uncharacterized protein n=1 Tax=Streptomyces fuscichromogenes TaxID=1324013 RepID=A0A917XFT7_9ACTN|nr:hypothetical protein GCM10011578_049580 [Streptomyces fuscichromogenes]